MWFEGAPLRIHLPQDACLVARTCGVFGRLAEAPRVWQWRKKSRSQGRVDAKAHYLLMLGSNERRGFADQSRECAQLERKDVRGSDGRGNRIELPARTRQRQVRYRGKIEVAVCTSPRAPAPSEYAPLLAACRASGVVSRRFCVVVVIWKKT